jgi:hypothetical protein
VFPVRRKFHQECGLSTKRTGRTKPTLLCALLWANEPGPIRPGGWVGMPRSIGVGDSIVLESWGRPMGGSAERDRFRPFSSSFPACSGPFPCRCFSCCFCCFCALAQLHVHSLSTAPSLDRRWHSRTVKLLCTAFPSRGLHLLVSGRLGEIPASYSIRPTNRKEYGVSVCVRSILYQHRTSPPPIQI